MDAMEEVSSVRRLGHGYSVIFLCFSSPEGLVVGSIFVSILELSLGARTKTGLAAKTDSKLGALPILSLIAVLSSEGAN